MRYYVTKKDCSRPDIAERMIFMPENTQKPNILLPPEVCAVLEVFASAGVLAYAVGGAVRDSLLGRPAHDWDIASPLAPDRTAELFTMRGFRVIPTGIRHGTVTILSGGMPIEVTTFRIDGGYSDGRHPDRVKFTDRVEDDLARRDFTVNAMAYSPARGLCDPWRGRDDLDAKMIRCVGDPAARFAEDALRILRAFRFAAQLGFTADGAVLRAASELRGRLSAISVERIAAEMVKLLLSPRPAAYLADMAQCGITEFVFAGVGFDMTDFPPLDLLPADAPGRMGALLRRAGLQDPGSIESTLGRLRLSGAFYRRARAAATLPLPSPDAAAVRRFMREAGNADAAIAAAAARGETNAARVAQLAEEISAGGGPVTLRTLAVNGSMLQKAGFGAGRQTGIILSALLDAVTEDPSLNNEEVLLSLAAEISGRTEINKK